MTLETMINGMGGVSSSPYSSVPRFSGKGVRIHHWYFIRQELLHVVSKACIQGPYRLAIFPNALLSLALEANDEFRLSHREYGVFR